MSTLSVSGQVRRQKRLLEELGYQFYTRDEGAVLDAMRRRVPCLSSLFPRMPPKSCQERKWVFLSNCPGKQVTGYPHPFHTGNEDDRPFPLRLEKPEIVLVSHFLRSYSNSFALDYGSQFVCHIRLLSQEPRCPSFLGHLRSPMCIT